MKKGCVFFTRARQTPSSFSPPLVTKVMRASNRSAFELSCIALYCVFCAVFVLYCNHSAFEYAAHEISGV